MLISKRERVRLKKYNGSKAFIEHSNYMNYIYENIGEKFRDKECKILTLFDDMIADMLSNKKFTLLETELFIKGKNLKVSLVFIAQSYFAEPQNIRLNSTHYFIMKIPNKQELQQIVFNHSSDIGYENFMNLYKKCTPKPYCFLVIDTALASYLHHIIHYVLEKIFQREYKNYS